INSHIAAPQVQYLLDPSTRIEHQCEQRIIAPPPRGRAIDTVQHGLDLAALEIFDRCLLRAVLERQSDDALKRTELLGVVSRHETREHVNGAEPRVTRRDAVFALGFEEA